VASQTPVRSGRPPSRANVIRGPTRPAAAPTCRWWRVLERLVGLLGVGVGSFSLRTSTRTWLTTVQGEPRAAETLGMEGTRGSALLGTILAGGLIVWRLAVLPQSNIPISIVAIGVLCGLFALNLRLYLSRR
jgi:hypothetical protein